MKKLTAILALTCTSLALPAAAQFAKPEDAVKYRQAAFTVLASNFSRMQPVIRGQAPYDAAQIKANVDVLKTLATLPWGGVWPGHGGRQCQAGNLVGCGRLQTEGTSLPGWRGQAVGSCR